MAQIESWRLGAKPQSDEPEARPSSPFVMPNVLLPLVVCRGSDAFPSCSGREFRKDDVVHFAIYTEMRAQAVTWLDERGWELVEFLDKDAPVSGLESAQAHR